ncbi:DUF5362 family protein [Pedobacter sp. AW31-3R]|uniref:DUF5362 family protein n=1 Tax=Pedobacter sp. AW31-3R TaxID=3445781 RepID=UPI003F9FC776
MDNFDEIKTERDENEEVDALWISEDIRSYIYDTAKWTRFLAIVGFVFSALVAISAFSVDAIFSSIAAANPGNPLLQLNPMVLTVMYLLFALVIFYPSFLLFKFSSSANQAVLFADQPSLTVAMNKLKSYFKFWGIMTIIVIGFYVLAIVSVVLLGLSAQGGAA